MILLYLLGALGVFSLLFLAFVGGCVYIEQRIVTAAANGTPYKIAGGSLVRVKLHTIDTEETLWKTESH